VITVKARIWKVVEYAGMFVWMVAAPAGIFNSQIELELDVQLYVWGVWATSIYLLVGMLGSAAKQTGKWRPGEFRDHMLVTLVVVIFWPVVGLLAWLVALMCLMVLPSTKKEPATETDPKVYDVMTEAPEDILPPAPKPEPGPLWRGKARAT
jgi:hypothetical protein